MTKILLQCVGEKDGLKIYSPVDIEDVKAIGGRDCFSAEIAGIKATRTLLQNRSIHKYAALVCHRMNELGWTKKKYYEVKEVDIGWTPESVLDDIWRGIQEAMFGHRGTSRLETEQVSKVYEVMSMHLATNCAGVDLAFPSRNSQMEECIAKSNERG